GPDLAGTLVDFGARRYQVRAAIASYDQSVATYRQTVLSAFQEVEDNLATLQVLARESVAERAAADAAAETLAIAENQYKAGTVDYLNVVSAQNAWLGAERAWRDITNRSLAASVALVQHPPHVRRERHVGDQVAGKELLAIVGVLARELQTRLGEADVAALDLGEAQQLQRLRSGEQVVDLHAQLLRDRRQVRLAVVGGARHRFHESGQHVGRYVREGGANAGARETLGLRPDALAARLRGHLHVYPVDERAEARVVRMTGLRQIDRDLAHDARRESGEDQQPVAHLHRFLDVVRHQDHRLDRQLPLAPEVEEVVAQPRGRAARSRAR